MSESNIGIVRAIYERWAEADFHGPVEFFDPEVAFVIHRFANGLMLSRRLD
jgi:hypothetical protein